MEDSQLLREQLASSVQGFVWAVEHIPVERRYSAPPMPNWLGQWSLARHVFHMQYQEYYVVQAGLKEMLHLPPHPEERPEEESAWQQEQRPLEELLRQFQVLREQTGELIRTLSQEEWATPREATNWEIPMNIHWFIAKVWQHTLEHTHDALRLYLFWDAAVEMAANPEKQS